MEPARVEAEYRTKRPGKPPGPAGPRKGGED